MLTVLSLAAAYAGWRLTRAAFQALRSVPRCNADMIFF
jgi:hypothetical protein